MSFLKRIFNFLSGGGSRDGRPRFDIYVLSHQCREPMTAQVDLYNSLSLTDDKGAIYFTRKVLQSTGAKRCFASVEVSLWFDGNRKLVRHEVSGGRWLTPEEFEAELERFNAPPEEEELEEEEILAEESDEAPSPDDTTTKTDQTGRGGFG